jgi:hypothetical protein
MWWLILLWGKESLVNGFTECVFFEYSNWEKESGVNCFTECGGLYCYGERLLVGKWG